MGTHLRLIRPNPIRGWKKEKLENGYVLTHANGYVSVSYSYSFGKKRIDVTAEGVDGVYRTFKTITEAKGYIQGLI